MGPAGGHAQQPEQTADYTRNQAEATAKVMKLRMEDRNRPKTGMTKDH
jgi:hypothetical protein